MMQVGLERRQWEHRFSCAHHASCTNDQCWKGRRSGSCLRVPASLPIISFFAVWGQNFSSHPTNRTCHATSHSPISTSAGIFPWASLSFRTILRNSFELLTLRGVRFYRSKIKRASTQIRVTQDAGKYLKRILGFHLIPPVSILHQSGEACSPPQDETQSKHPQPLARTKRQCTSK